MGYYRTIDTCFRGLGALEYNVCICMRNVLETFCQEQFYSVCIFLGVKYCLHVLKEAYRCSSTSLGGCGDAEGDRTDEVREKSVNRRNESQQLYVSVKGSRLERSGDGTKVSN